MYPIEFVCAALVLAVPVVILVGALVVRTAVWLANQSLRAYTKPARVSDAEDAEDEFAGLYAERVRITAIRPLNFGHALGFSFVVRLVQVCGAVVHVFFDKHARLRGLDGLALGGFLALVSFLVAAGVCAILLPTSFGRGCLVALFDLLISAAIVAAIALPLLLFG